MFDFAFDLSRVNHRMHNKVMVADNAVVIVGGRNIGNHYFGVATAVGELCTILWEVN
jgi:putative cardiolipin synthase